MEFLIKAAQLLLSLSILVVLHEFGHFLPAKFFKTRIEKFYLFFNPWFALFKRKIGETEWGIGWLPLGGFVKISGMVDESMDTEQLAQEPKPWEFRSKPAWQRLIIMTGGVIVNFLVAFLIYAMVLWTYGKEYASPNTVKYGMHLASEKMAEYGFQEGDIPLQVDGIPIETANGTFKSVLIDGGRNVTVLRNGKEYSFQLPEEIDQNILKNSVRGFYGMPRFPVVIDEVSSNSNAEKAGLLANDSILAVNEVATPYFMDFKAELEKHKDKPALITFVRNGKKLEKKVSVSENGMIGFVPKQMDAFLELETEKYGFFESFPAGVSYGVDILSSYVKSMSLIFTKEGVSQVGGFGAMGKIFPAEWNWKIFWTNTALISIILAFMNILPIPALDGGHVAFLLYEMVTGREAPQKVLEYAQYAGFFILIALMLYANGNDLYKWFAGG